MAVMSDDAADAITRLLENDAIDADERAARLLPLVYEQLHAAARILMVGERAGHTLQPTALVHEAYLRIIGDRKLPWKNRAHFYTAAAEAMRRILIDHARGRGRLRRGGDRRRVTLSVVDVADSWNLEEILSLDDALRRLEDKDRAVGEVIRLRFFVGMSIAQTAEVLGISPATVKRRWEFGRTWLFREISGGYGHE